ncbi:MAG: hypothetical protein RIS94_1700 [Pseudomonadota bacterium]|jgi:pimeloyl-ACP methyl ester carboxylesterase
MQTLILLPGSLCDARVWQHQMRDLAGIAHVVCPSLHGHDSLESMADAVLGDAPDSFALCGFSMGGRVALEIMRRAPGRISRLALVDASVHPVAEGEAVRRQPQIDMARDQGMVALARWWNPKIVHPSRTGDAALMGLLEDMACTFTADDYAEEVHALLNRPDPRDVLPTVKVPTLVLAGSEDPLSTRDRNEAIAAAIGGAQLLLVEGAAHFPMLEQPGVVTAALREWLYA